MQGRGTSSTADEQKCKALYIKLGSEFSIARIQPELFLHQHVCYLNSCVFYAFQLFQSDGA